MFVFNLILQSSDTVSKEDFKAIRGKVRKLRFSSQSEERLGRFLSQSEKSLVKKILSQSEERLGRLSRSEERLSRFFSQSEWIRRSCFFFFQPIRKLVDLLLIWCGNCAEKVSDKYKIVERAASSHILLKWREEQRGCHLDLPPNSHS